MLKTKLMVRDSSLHCLTGSGKYPYGVYCKSAGVYSIYCKYCYHWAYKRFTKIFGSLTAAVDFKCQRCLGMAPLLDKRSLKCK